MWSVVGPQLMKPAFAVGPASNDSFAAFFVLISIHACLASGRIRVSPAIGWPLPSPYAIIPE